MIDGDSENELLMLLIVSEKKKNVYTQQMKSECNLENSTGLFENWNWTKSDFIDISAWHKNNTATKSKLSGRN